MKKKHTCITFLFCLFLVFVVFLDDNFVADKTLGITPPIFSYPSSSDDTCEVLWRRFTGGEDMITQMGE